MAHVKVPSKKEELKKVFKEIIQMAKNDQRMRKHFQRTGEWNSEIDKKNAKRIKEIIQKFGWPTVQIAGEEAGKSAWLLVQHADNDVNFQKICLRLMEKAQAKNKKSIMPQYIAYLKDRVLVNTGRKQLFGTQFYFDKKGNFLSWPIADYKHLDERRKEYKLGSFEKYKKAAFAYKPRRPA